MVSYSDIKYAAYTVWVDYGCTLLNPSDPNKALDTSEPNSPWHSDTHNISEYPVFVTGRLGNYYLSQTDAGQAQTSPCVDIGSQFASDLGLTKYTTRTDDIPDGGTVDMGFHYPSLVDLCRLCDLATPHNSLINFEDLAVFVSWWLEEDCAGHNNRCEGADLTFDTYVDFFDYSVFAGCWYVHDACGPIPNPSEWLIKPYYTSEAETSVSMTVRTSYDAWSWPIEYYFECVYGDCHDSGWQSETTYEDTGLIPENEYGYRVKARDTSAYLNETAWSVIAYVGFEDTTPPAPARPVRPARWM